jgi:HD-GYP domain-containing protein (c-di-GMP phosphodiesterase class II)
MPYTEARDIIAAGRGKHFDPDMVDAFLASFDDFVAINERYLNIKLKPKHHHVIANEAIQPRNLS